MLKMENLKDEGEFKSRADFTLALKKYALGSFGDSNQFKMVKDSAVTIDYKCTQCVAPPNIRIRVQRELIESERNGIPDKKKCKGRMVTIVFWRLCYCDIKEVGTVTLPTLPPIGTIFATREAFTKAMSEFSKKNRKMKYKLKDNGNRMTRSCPIEACPGMVEAELVKTKIPKGKGKTWGPPITITKSIPCQDGCRVACAETTVNCAVCQSPVQKSEMIWGMCCGGAESLCFTCLIDYLEARPTNMCRWMGSDSLLRKLVKVGLGPGEVWYRCPVSRCVWDYYQMFGYQDTKFKIKDWVPYGFIGDVKLETETTYEMMKTRYLEKVARCPERNRACTPEMTLEAGRRALDEALGAVTEDTPRRTNMRRMAIVCTNHPDMVAEDIEVYIRGRGLWVQQSPGRIRNQANG
jgi:hypothetical protein